MSTYTISGPIDPSVPALTIAAEDDSPAIAIFRTGQVWLADGLTIDDASALFWKRVNQVHGTAPEGDPA